MLVIGASGRLGGVVAQGLADAGHAVVRGVRLPDLATDSARLVDLDRPETVRRALRDADVAVSTFRHPELAAERLALATDGAAPLLSVASLSRADRAALERLGGPGRVIVHAGLNPGLMTLVLAELVAGHPETERLDLAASVAPLQAMGAAAFDSVMPFLAGPGRRPVARIRLPEPLGWRRCLALGSGECGWLGALADEREGHVWLTFHQPAVGAVVLLANRLGVAGKLPRRAFRLVEGRARTPLSDEPKRDWAGVSAGGRLLASAAIDGIGDYRVSVAAIVTQAEALLASPPDQPGVTGAEVHFRLADLEPALARRGVRILRFPASTARPGPSEPWRR